MTAVTPEPKPPLAETLALAVIETRTRQLMDLTNPPDMPLRGAFIDLCRVSVQALEGTPDAELASHAAAGPLVRYLLHAMKSYLDAGSEAKLPTAKSREVLARAFGIEAPVRGDTGATLAGELALCEEYRRVLVGAVDVMGKRKPNAHDLAIKAMFEKKHVRQPKNDGGDKSKTRALEALLKKHYYTTTEAQRQEIRRRLDLASRTRR